MKITMDMSSYEIENDTIEFEEFEELGEEILDTGWNPAVDLVCGLQQIEATVDYAADDSTAAVLSEIVLRKMYSYKE